MMNKLLNNIFKTILGIDINSLLSENRTLKGQITSLKRESADLKGRLSVLKKSNEEKSDEIERLNSTISNKVSIIVQRQLQFGRYFRLYKEARGNVEALTTDNQRLNEEISGFSTLVDELNKKAEILTECLDEEKIEKEKEREDFADAVFS